MLVLDSVADQGHFDPDPTNTFNFDTDPDPSIFFFTDQDLNCLKEVMRLKWLLVIHLLGFSLIVGWPGAKRQAYIGKFSISVNSVALIRVGSGSENA